LRGLGVVLPPLLTVVIFVWVWSTINLYILTPVEAAARNYLVWQISEVREPGAGPNAPKQEIDGREFARLESGQYVPTEVVEYVTVHSGAALPVNGRAVYERYIDLKYLRAIYVVPIFVVAFLIFIYVLGGFIAAGVGAFFWGLLERVIGRLPLVRNVYSSVKQVTDFMLNRKQMSYTRVVAVQYPCAGVWAIGFVTGESLLDIRAAVNEPVLAVLVPCSPMPMAARSVTVRKSEVVELNLTVDQALQFIVSCGVVVPPHQVPPKLSAA